MVKLAAAKTKKSGRRAGGRATEGGLSFQAEVAAWIAAHLLADLPVGERFGLGHGESVVMFRCESGEGMDDVDVRLSGGGVLRLQCKTTLSLSDKLNSEFGKTVAQLVKEVSADPAMSADQSALVIAVSPSASGTLDTLETACRRVATVGPEELEHGFDAESEAFGKLMRVADAAATKIGLASLDYRQLASLLRIRRFERGAGGATRISAAHLLGRRLFGREENGAKL